LVRPIDRSLVALPSLALLVIGMSVDFMSRKTFKQQRGSLVISLVFAVLILFYPFVWQFGSSRTLESDRDASLDYLEQRLTEENASSEYRQSTEQLFIDGLNGMIDNVEISYNTWLLKLLGMALVALHIAYLVAIPRWREYQSKPKPAYGMPAYPPARSYSIR
jgi:hypothetical protein